MPGSVTAGLSPAFHRPNGYNSSRDVYVRDAITERHADMSSESKEGATRFNRRLGIVFASE
jgi:hypothetical protein